jgi:hypothetical protein
LQHLLCLFIADCGIGPELSQEAGLQFCQNVAQKLTLELQVDIFEDRRVQVF